MADTIFVSNTTQGTLSINCSFLDKDGNLIPKYYDVPPARMCIGVKIDKDDWNRVKDTMVVKAWIDGGFLLPEKKKVTIDQETLKTSEPEVPAELAEATIGNLAKGGEAVNIEGSRRARTTLKG